MNKSRLVVLVLVLGAVATAQTRILVYDFEARGVDVKVTRANTEVLRDALNNSYKYVVIDPPVGTFCYNVLAAADSARAYGAALALIGNIMAVGSKQMVTYQLVDAASSSLVLADKFELPPMEEFPTMAERVAASIVERKPYEGTIEPGKVLEPETAQWIKHPRKPHAGIMMTAGYSYLLNRPESYFATRLVNLNIAVSFETQRLLTLLQIGYLRGMHEEKDIAFDLLGHYVFGNGDFAPFVGGGLGITKYSWAEPEPNYRKRENDALVVSAGGGMLGLRTYYFRLIGAAYADLAIPGSRWSDGSQASLVPGVRLMFGVCSPSFGPDATVKTSPVCIGGAIGAVFLTGLVVMLTSD